MIARSVDIDDPNWIKMRDFQWVRMEEKLIDCRYSKKKQAVLRELFYGRIGSYTDTSLKIIDIDERGYLFIDLNPHQCQENWEWVIKEGWNEVNPKRLHKSEVEVYQRFVERFKEDILRANLEWTLDERLTCFKFLFGEVYRRENFSFMGHEINHPLNPYWVLYQLAISINYMLIGFRLLDDLWANLHAFSIEAFKYVDPLVFLPESKVGKNRFTQADAKCAWCRVFYTLANNERMYNECKSNEKQIKRLNGVSYTEYTQTKEMSDLLKLLDTGMQSGVIPKELLALKDFAETVSHKMRHFYLKKCTLSSKYHLDDFRKELDEQNAAEENKEKVEIDNEESVMTNLNHDASTEKVSCEGVELFRQYALQQSLHISKQPFDSVEKYLNWAKRHGIKLGKVQGLNEVQRLNQLKNKSDLERTMAYAKILESSNTGYIHLDVFGECSPGTINLEYRTAWKELFRLVGSAVIVKSLKVNKKGTVGDGFDIKVTIVTDKQTHVFNYVMDSDWLDESLLSDANVFAENEGLRWRYQFDDGDAGKSVTYLPPAIVKLLK